MPSNFTIDAMCMTPWWPSGSLRRTHGGCASMHTMMIESTISLLVSVIVAARAVNVLLSLQGRCVSSDCNALHCPFQTSESLGGLRSVREKVFQTLLEAVSASSG